MIELYKFYIHKKIKCAPQPLILGYRITDAPFDSRKIHVSKQYYIFKYTLSGCGLISDGDKVWKLLPGSVMLLKFPNDKYYFSLEEGMEQWQGIYLEFEAGDLEQLIAEQIENYGVVYELEPEGQIVNMFLAYHKKYCKYNMNNVNKNQIFSNNIGISGLDGSQLIYRILTELRITDATKRKLNHNLLNATCEYINNNLDKNINIESIAKELSISRGHLMRVFSNRMGITLHRYIIIAKIKTACQLLNERILTIEEISEKIGLRSSIYFYRMFKREIGMTPGSFCRSDQQEEIIKSLR